MKPIRALTLLCGLLAPLVAAAAEPKAELAGGAIATDVTVRGAKQPHYRLAAGQTLKLRLRGPAELGLEVRVEGGLPAKPVVAALKLDGKVAAKTRTSAEVEPEATSDRSLGVSRAAVLAVSIPAGKHTATLRWPRGMSRDALVAIKGVRVATPKAAATPPALALSLPEIDLSGAPSLPPPPLPLPLPEKSAAPEPLPPPPPETNAAPKPSTVAAAPPAKAPQLSKVEASAAGETPKPLAASAPPAMGPAAMTGERLRPDSAPWSVTLLAGAERSSEQFTDAAALAHLGVEATRTIWVTGLAVFQFDWRNSRQPYVLGQPGLGAAKDISPVDEQRYDTLLGIGYDFGPLFNNPRLVLAPVVGLKYVRLQNRAFPADLFGVDLMGRVRYSLSTAVGVHANFGWIYNLVHSTHFSAIGTPLGQFGVRAGFDFPLAGGYALSLDYQGDILAFDYSNRVAHGASAGFGKSF